MWGTVVTLDWSAVYLSGCSTAAFLLTSGTAPSQPAVFTLLGIRSVSVGGWDEIRGSLRCLLSLKVGGSCVTAVCVNEGACHLSFSLLRQAADQEHHEDGVIKVRSGALWNLSSLLFFLLSPQSQHFNRHRVVHSAVRGHHCHHGLLLHVLLLLPLPKEAAERQDTIWW